jgi:hypothetical protein
VLINQVILPSLRSGQLSLDEAEHFPAQSRCQRRCAPMVFGCIPDARSESSRIQRSASPESPSCSAGSIRVTRLLLGPTRTAPAIRSGRESTRDGRQVRDGHRKSRRRLHREDRKHRIRGDRATLGERRPCGVERRATGTTAPADFAVRRKREESDIGQ